MAEAVDKVISRLGRAILIRVSTISHNVDSKTDLIGFYYCAASET
jgi:hypothetical protein